MATKSILKTVNIKDKKLGKSLVIALENAKDKKNLNMDLNYSCKDIRGELLRKFFNE